LLRAKLMPELPEVETVVRDVRPFLVGHRFNALKLSRHSLRRRWLPKWTAQVLGRSIRAVERRGKWILIDLDGPRLVIHLGMTGQLTIVDSANPVADHTHLIFTLDDKNRQLRFRDIRRFGSAALFANAEAVNAFFEEAGLGPEPFAIDPAYWRDCLQRTGRSLKAVLLDQRVVAGVGNIYADESLFEAKLLPKRLGKELSPKEADRLRNAVSRVLSRAIDKRGSTIRDYVGGSGLKGGFQNEFRVYGRTDEPCTRCREAIVRIVLAGRSTHFCQRCQK
jgi:formamidopyrimidine-DNA glycosylase